MSKPTKPAAAPAKEVAVEAPPKSKKKTIIIASILLLGIAGAAGWYFTKGHNSEGHAEEVKVEPVLEAKFVPLGENFTVNLQREEGDQYLQAGITLKILEPELEEKIKKAMPEIRSKLLFLLSSKRPSELQTADGKKKLVAEIIAETDNVLGIAPAAAATSGVPATPAHDAGHEAPAHAETASAVTAASAPTAAPVAVVAAPKTTGVVDVLFTSFIIQ